MESDTTDSGRFRMEGSLRRYLLIYTVPFLIGIVLTYFYATTVITTGHPWFLLLVIPLYAYVFADVFVWIRRGIRSVEMDALGMKVFRSGDPSGTVVEADQMTGVYVSRFLDRTTVNILLRGAAVKRVLGIRRYSGPRIRMTNEPFDRSQFSEFIQKVSKLRRTPLVKEQP
jgi:hypothetical protein